MTAEEWLASRGGSPLGAADDSETVNSASLAKLLQLKNGFYAFESSLHVRSAAMVLAWNEPNGWRLEFPGLPGDLVFFAEDVFGCQYGVDPDGVVVRLDPETGVAERVASSIREWAEMLEGDFDYLTGWSLAHAWQNTNGPLIAGERLAAKVPFVLGGAYVVENLFALEASELMRSRASIAAQIRDLPDGARVRLAVED